MDSSIVQSSIDNAVKILEANIHDFGPRFWENSSKNNRYQPTRRADWTEGYITGCYWLAWEETHRDIFKDTALQQVDAFLERITVRDFVDHHDMGVLFSPSCVAAYKLTGDETAKKAALMAADNLLNRFQERGQFFQAWGDYGARDNYRMIIDGLNNLPILYWASDVTGDPKYRDKAVAHTETALKVLFRPDWSSYHTFFFDPETGKPDRGVTAQGYRSDTPWARGQAWGIYGVALNYRCTRNPQSLEIFKHIADFFMDHLPSSGVPYWDFSFPDGSDEPWDSSAAAIAACGMLEMTRYLPPDDAEKYHAAACRLLDALTETCAVKDISQANGLLMHGVYGKSSPFNTVPDDGVDECNCWGDYYYLEALTRLKNPDWVVYW